MQDQSSSDKRSSPAIIYRHLLPREVELAWVHQHRAVLIAPIALTVAGLLVALILGSTYVHGLANDIMWIAWGLLFLRLAWKVANWAVFYFVVTNERLLLLTGFLTRQVSMMPKTKVTEMRFQRTLPGRLLGYGEFIVESAGPDQALRHVRFIPYPEDLYVLICGMLFPSSADDEDDEAIPVADEEAFVDD
jgi:Bacterial PH domain